MIPFVSPDGGSNWALSPAGIYILSSLSSPDHTADSYGTRVPVVGYKIDGLMPRQCKDIPVRPILEFIAQNGGIGCHRFDTDWTDPDGEYRTRGVKAAFPEGIPDRLMLAKLRGLDRRDLIDGCCCGCRGDFEITEKGLEYLEQLKEGDR